LLLIFYDEITNLTITILHTRLHEGSFFWKKSEKADKYILYMTKMQDESGIGGSCMTRIVKGMNSYINTQGNVKFNRRYKSTICRGPYRALKRAGGTYPVHHTYWKNFALPAWSSI